MEQATTLRTLAIRKRLAGERRLAGRVLVAGVEYPGSAPFFDKLTLAAREALYPRRHRRSLVFVDVLALGVAWACEKFTKAPCLLHQQAAAIRAGYLGDHGLRYWHRLTVEALGGNFLTVLTGRVVGAGDKLAKAAELLHKWARALRAGPTNVLGELAHVLIGGF